MRCDCNYFHEIFSFALLSKSEGNLLRGMVVVPGDYSNKDPLNSPICRQHEL